MPELAGTQLKVVDVAEDESLQARYGQRLPVLSLAGRGVPLELDWPFDAGVVAASIGQLE